MNDGDLVLFQIENNIWVAALYPILSQVVCNKDYEIVKKKAVEYAIDKKICIYLEVDANTNSYLLIKKIM